MIKSIELHFSNVCNLNCYYCFTRKYRDNKLDLMSFDIFNKALTFIKKNNIPYISISGGGEPLLNTNCFEYFNEIVNNNIKFGLSTNLTQILKYTKSDILWLLNNAEFINITYHPISKTELSNNHIDRALNYLKSILDKKYDNIKIKIPIINKESENIIQKLTSNFSNITDNIVAIPLFGSEYNENILYEVDVDKNTLNKLNNYDVEVIERIIIKK